MGALESAPIDKSVDQNEEMGEEIFFQGEQTKNSLPEVSDGD